MTSPSQKSDQHESLNFDPTKRIVVVELEKNETGFGFNITGGTDEPYIPGHSGIFIARIRPEGVAARDGRLREGDRIISVNDAVLSDKTHAEAVEIFKEATGKVRLLIEQDAETIVLSKPANILPTPLGGSPTNDPVLKSILKSSKKSIPNNSSVEILKENNNAMTATVTIPNSETNSKTSVEFKENIKQSDDVNVSITLQPKKQSFKAPTSTVQVPSEIPLQIVKNNESTIRRTSTSASNGNLAPGVVLPSSRHTDDDDDRASTISVAPSTHSIIDDVPRTPKKPISILDPASPSVMTEVLFVSIGAGVLAFGFYLGLRFFKR